MYLCIYHKCCCHAVNGYARKNVIAPMLPSLCNAMHEKKKRRKEEAAIRISRNAAPQRPAKEDEELAPACADC